MLIGYIRATGGDRDALPGHGQALRDAGCERLVEDPVSGSGRDQPGLREVLDGLRAGDVVVVPRLGQN